MFAFANRRKETSTIYFGASILPINPYSTIHQKRREICSASDKPETNFCFSSTLFSAAVTSSGVEVGLSFTIVNVRTASNASCSSL